MSGARPLPHHINPDGNVKKKFTTVAAAEDWLVAHHLAADVYPCPPPCGAFHIGHVTRSTRRATAFANRVRRQRDTREESEHALRVAARIDAERRARRVANECHRAWHWQETRT